MQELKSEMPRMTKNKYFIILNFGGCTMILIKNQIIFNKDKLAMKLSQVYHNLFEYKIYLVNTAKEILVLLIFR